MSRALDHRDVESIPVGDQKAVLALARAFYGITAAGSDPRVARRWAVARARAALAVARAAMPASVRP